MSLAAKIRRQGFKIRAVENGNLYIEPIDKLEPEQLNWIKSNKGSIRQELLNERWRWFLSLSAEYGIHPSVIGAEFPTEQDRLDVAEPIEHDDAKLRQFMLTLTNCTRVQQRQQNYESGRWVPVDQNGEVAA